ncbi:hypothetical protein [Streptomyces lushanensis]|uniref:hypothetical protein n=1 Tax=Streptomyces lushanensis TaxID=1434255 RepID=UPI00082E25FC|nr:hypothetical protein [Streptomyces lushanensis]
MDVLTLVSAVVALGSASAAAVLGYWTQRRLRTMEQRNLMETYGASLAWAAFDLQSRLFNILRGYVVDQAPGPGHGFLTGFLTRGTPEEAEYVRRSTVFVLAEYLGWVEILRRDVQFLDLGRSRTNQAVMVQISEVGSALGRISSDSNELRLFRTQQRAVGELMVHPDGEPGRRRCLGFAEFSAKLDTDDGFRVWFGQLLSDVDRLAEDTGAAVVRLEGIQQQLVILLDLLDPKSVRFPRFRVAFDRDHRTASTPI